MSGRRVVVTGIGLMSALGTTRDTTWNRMLRGDCGIAEVSLFDATDYRSRMAAEIPAYLPDGAMSPKAWARLSRSDQTALIAAREALADSGVFDSPLERHRVGVVFGTGTGVKLNFRAPRSTILQIDAGHSILPQVYRGAGSFVLQVLLLKPL